MTDGTRSQGTAPEPGSVERAVTREARRTRTLLIVFACLLAVPIAAGVLVFQFARSDAEVVSHQVKAQVESKLAPVEQTLREARTAKAEVQGVSRDLGRQREQVEALTREQVALKQTLERTAKGGGPAALQEEVRRLREAVQKQEAAQARILEKQQLLETDLRKFSNAIRPEDIRRIQEDVVRLRRRLDELPRPPPPGGGGVRR